MSAQTPASGLPEALTFASVQAVLERSEPLIAAGVLDLSAVRRADSAGISLLLELTRRAAAAGTSLQLSGAPAQVRELSAFFGVDSLLKFQ